MPQQILTCTTCSSHTTGWPCHSLRAWEGNMYNSPIHVTCCFKGKITALEACWEFDSCLQQGVATLFFSNSQTLFFKEIEGNLPVTFALSGRDYFGLWLKDDGTWFKTCCAGSLDLLLKGNGGVDKIVCYCRRVQ